MPESPKYLKERWNNELAVLQSEILVSLESGKLRPEDLPKTEEGLSDLRGFNLPKEYAEHKSNSGRTVKYVLSSIRINRMKFVEFDLSHSDFEKCEFWNCEFENTKFYKTRFKACSFQSCNFSKLTMESTDLAQCIIGKSLLKLKSPSIRNVNFVNSNLSGTHVVGIQIFEISIIYCKTGSLLISKSNIDGLNCQGEIKNLFLHKNKMLARIDFAKADVVDLQVGGNLENSDKLLQSLSVRELVL